MQEPLEGASHHRNPKDLGLWVCLASKSPGAPQGLGSFLGDPALVLLFAAFCLLSINTPALPGGSSSSSDKCS